MKRIKSKYRRTTGLALLCAALFASQATAQITGTGAGTTGKKEPEKTTRALAGSGVEVEQSVSTGVKAGDVVRKYTPTVQPGLGTIVLIAPPGANVALTPQVARGKAETLNFTLDQDKNTLTLSKLKPGSYTLSATHPDYKDRTETVAIKSGDVKPYPDFLAPKYGEIVIGGAPIDVDLKVDGQVPDPKLVARNTAEGKITISRLLEGKHTVTLSKEGYDPWTKEINVTPGETSPETAEVKLATVTLTVNSRPGARVYINKADRGATQSDGKLILEDMLPGTYQMRVALDGFNDYEQPLALTLAERKPMLPVNLIPVAESGERAEDFTTGASKWIVPSTWKLDKKGLVVSGNDAGLFKDPTEDRAFNVYFDYIMTADVRFSNGRGVSWIARAKDTKNYYLFELTPSPRRFNFYICREGQCTLKDARPVVEKLDEPNDSYTIQFEARGSKFMAKLSRLLAPSADGPQPIGTFDDRENTFSHGGIGFRGLNGSEVLLQSLVIIPVKRENVAGN
ncbi:MAG: PEGA domain-containing protein [Blastocatellales bacterium]|nr:PEGA domain-containing protein [Blastocatellales bacterium]